MFYILVWIWVCGCRCVALATAIGSSKRDSVGLENRWMGFIYMYFLLHFYLLFLFFSCDLFVLTSTRRSCQEQRPLSTKTFRPHDVGGELLQMDVNPHLVLWVLSFLTARPQWVRVIDCKNNTIYSLWSEYLATLAPQGYEAFPLIFIYFIWL